MTRQSVPSGRGQVDGEALPWSALLRGLRLAAGVTQEGWAARLGYGRRTIQRWERGEGLPDEAATDALVRLCGELRLYRPYRQGVLAGLPVTAELLRGLLAEARQGRRQQSMQQTETSPTDRSAPLVDKPASRTWAGQNLTAELSSFIGREGEVVAVSTALEDARLVTLIGTGGVGKTRLALRVAAQVVERFADGAWLAELATLVPPTNGYPALVPHAVARAVGVREQPGRTIEASLEEALGPRRLLLVLDNCEHLSADCAALAARLLRACPELHILATSREPLGVPGEIAWAVPPLAVPTQDTETTVATLARVEAVRLFATRAGTAWPGFVLHELNATAVARICRRLDGLPLAIELAAALVRAVAPDEIAARLDDRFRLLVRGDRAAPPRQQTLRATIDWSYDLLDPAERRLLDCLSIFADRFDLAAAEAVCAGEGIAVTSVLELLVRLVDRSLVSAQFGSTDGSTRFRLLETLRAYGRERLAARGELARAGQRHAAWIVALAEEAARALHGPEQGHWLRWVEEAHSDVRAALGWALTAGDTATALRLGEALWWAWGVQERRGEGRSWLERALELPGTAAQLPLRARVLAHLAIFAAFQGDIATARARLDEGDTIGQALEDEGALLVSRGTRALLLQIGGQFDAAADLAGESLSLARRVGDAWWESRVLEMLAHAALRQGDPASATALLEDGVRLARQAGDDWGLATTLAELGDVARAHGAPAEAAARYAESLALREGLGIPAATPSLRHNLGYVALALGDPAVAALHFTEALVEFQRLGERRGIAECLIGLGAVAAAEGRGGGGARLLGAGMAALAALGTALWPSNRADYDRAVGLTRAALDAPEFAAAWAEGEALSMERASALALGHESSPSR